MKRARVILIWAVLAAALIAPVAIAAMSPQLAWRRPIYIAAGFAGIISMGLLLVQPLLVGGYLPGAGGRTGRAWHRWIGGGLVVAVLAHVIGLWLTSPPDVVDALLFRSPTPFSIWGVISMWAVFAAAVLAVARRRLQIRPLYWRIAHLSLAAVIVIGAIIHALLIEGTMGQISKIALCVLVVAALAKLLFDFWRAGFFGRRAPRSAAKTTGD